LAFDLRTSSQKTKSQRALIRGTTMNRNNFLPHVALALILILVAAFAGQLRRWQTQWKSRMRIIPAEEKRREPINNTESAPFEPRQANAPEVMVKFKPGSVKRRFKESLTA
jgi:hypothetical protein